MWKHTPHLEKHVKCTPMGNFSAALISSLFSQNSTIMAEAITMIETQRSSTRIVLTTL